MSLFARPGVIMLVAAAFSLASCFLLMPLAKKVGLMDQPSRRKVHSKPVPLVGGLGVYFTLVIFVLFASPDAAEAVPLLLACGLMLITGLVDDCIELSPRIRFVLQVAACCIMIFAGGAVLTDFGSLLWNGVLSLGWLSVPITIFAAVGVINAFNMVDGLDGLSAMVFLVASAAMAWMALASGHFVNASLLIVAFGAVLGYFMLNARLPWNHRARIFLGDSGSVFMGMFLAWQFIDLGNGDDRAFEPMIAVWLLGIPLLDTTRLMWDRWRRGGSAFSADQYHLHHAFLKAGFSVAQTWFAIFGLVLLTTAIALAGHVFGWASYLMFYGFLLFGLVYWSVMRHCWRDGLFLGRHLTTAIKF
jgi:UDP-GlcNAc:undecaprenyl-phosphate GlcNAc-1-phosphate transferase